MSNRRPFGAVRFRYRELIHVLSLLAVALVLATVLAPTLTSFASVHFASPASPVSPILRPKLPPTFMRPRAGALRPTVPAPTSQAGTQTPEKVQPTTPAVQTPERVQAPPPSPVVTEPVASPPPTLWIVAGLLVIGAIVAALIFFRKS